MASTTMPQPTMAMSTSPTFLANCPAEILTMMASELSFEDLKSFRLVSKVFAAPGAQSLFERPVILFETSQSIARLHNLSNAPNLLNAIRLIKEFQLWTVRPFKSSGEQQPIEGPRDRQMERDNILGTEQLKEGLNAAFKRLTNIDSIVVGDLETSHPFARAPTGGEDLLRDAIQHDGERAGASLGRALAIISNAVACSHLELHHLVATVGYLWPMGRDTVLSLEHMFNKLRSLRIDINMDDDANPEINANGPQSSLHDISSSHPSTGADEFPEKNIIPLLLEGAQKLEQMTVNFPLQKRRPWPRTSLEAYIGKKAWPYLRILHLKSINTDTRSLLNVIKRNGSSLKALTMSQPRLRGPDWPLFFDTLREFIKNGELELHIFFVVWLAEMGRSGKLNFRN